MKANQVNAVSAVSPRAAAKAAAAKAADKAAKAAAKIHADREAKKQADRAARSTLSDDDLLKIMLRMSDADRSSAFKVMTVLRQQGISSSRVRIRRVIAEYMASQSAKPARKNGNGNGNGNGKKNGNGR